MAANPWPLVGREREIGSLEGALAAGGAVVVGEAGVGKTRLVDEAVARHRKSVVVVTTTEAAQDIPLAAFAPLLGSDARRGALHDRIGHAVRVVEEAVGDGVLFVDDAHHLDGASTALLAQLVTSAGTAVVATVRTPPDPPPEVVALWKDARLERVEVGPLSRDTTATLVSAVLGEGVDVALLDRLWKLSQGNVLFLRELVLSALEARGRGEPGERIPLSALDDPGRRLRELVGARVARLEPDLREALDLVAAAEPLPLAVADLILDAGALEQLERRGLLRVDGDDYRVLRTAHPLHGEVVRADMPPLRRRGLLRRVVEATPDPGTGLDVLRMATWRLDADDDEDPEFLATGAWEAFHRFDNPLAERLGRRAFERGSREGGFVLAEALMGQGRADAADEVLDGLVPETDEERARCAVARSANAFWQRGDADAALAILEAAEAELAARADLCAECRGRRAQVLFISGRFGEAVGVADSVLADAAASPTASLRAGLVAAPAWAAAGRLDDVLGAIDGWIETCAANPNAVPMADLLLRAMKFMTLAWAGRAREAEAFAADDLGLSFEDAPAGLQAILLGVRGRAAFARGRIRRAAALLHEAVEIGRHDDWFGLQPWALAFRARAEIYLGNLDAARAALDEAEAVAERMGLVTVNAVLSKGDVALARAWLAAAEGARSEACDKAAEVAARVASDTLPVAVDALHTVVRLGRGEAVAEDLARMSKHLQGPLASLVTAHAEAASAGDAAGVVAVADGFEELGLDLLAAETLSAAAELHRAQGKQGSALTCEERAGALRKACDVPASLAMARVEVEGAERLTDREREVALLAAHGSTSPEIAERLYISVRTVHTHLQRAYRKLGVNDREALAQVFEVHP
jgi:DNA-binding CsgD family transcriptional regulator